MRGMELRSLPYFYGLNGNRQVRILSGPVEIFFITFFDHPVIGWFFLFYKGGINYIVKQGKPLVKQPLKCKGCVWGRWEGSVQFCSRVICQRLKKEQEI